MIGKSVKKMGNRRDWLACARASLRGVLGKGIKTMDKGYNHSFEWYWCLK